MKKGNSIGKHVHLNRYRSERLKLLKTFRMFDERFLGNKLRIRTNLYWPKNGFWGCPFLRSANTRRRFLRRTFRIVFENASLAHIWALLILHLWTHCWTKSRILDRIWHRSDSYSDESGMKNKAVYSNRVCKIIGTDILLLYEVILYLVPLSAIQILSLEVVFAHPFWD